jgi:hypothetical protein
MVLNEEHGVVDTIMGQLAQTPVEDETWAANFSVMKENLEQHRGRRRRDVSSRRMRSSTRAISRRWVTSSSPKQALMQGLP